MPIQDVEIESIQKALAAGVFAEPWPFLEAGQRVRVEDGPLAGVEGVLINVRDTQRIVISVSLLRRSLAVEVERKWIEPLDRPVYRRQDVRTGERCIGAPNGTMQPHVHSIRGVQS